MGTIFNFGLLFEEDHNLTFIKYSQLVNNKINNKSDFCLSDNSLPHLTILQFEADTSILNEFWNAINQFDLKLVKLELAGLTFLPSKDGHIWLEISVLKSNELIRLQEAACSLVGNSKIHSGTGNSYRPHITIARALDRQEMPPLMIDNNVVRRKGVIGSVSVGISGPNYQYVNSLFKYKI